MVPVATVGPSMLSDDVGLLDVRELRGSLAGGAEETRASV
jgi:hypothetical protein